MTVLLKSAGGSLYGEMDIKQALVQVKTYRGQIGDKPLPELVMIQSANADTRQVSTCLS